MLHCPICADLGPRAGNAHYSNHLLQSLPRTTMLAAIATAEIRAIKDQARWYACKLAVPPAAEARMSASAARLTIAPAARATTVIDVADARSVGGTSLSAAVLRAMISRPMAAPLPVTAGNATAQ